MVSSNVYICGVCDDRCIEFDDEAARAEFKERFPDEDVEAAVKICDRCDKLARMFFKV